MAWLEHRGEATTFVVMITNFIPPSLDYQCFL